MFDDDDDELIEEKVLEMIKNIGGVQFIGDLYHNHVSYEKDVIEKAFVKYLVQNNLVATDVVDHLLEELAKILVEKMVEGDENGVMEGLTKSNLQEKMLEKCRKAH